TRLVSQHPDLPAKPSPYTSSALAALDRLAAERSAAVPLRQGGGGQAIPPSAAAWLALRHHVASQMHARDSDDGAESGGWAESDEDVAESDGGAQKALEMAERTSKAREQLGKNLRALDFGGASVSEGEGDGWATGAGMVEDKEVSLWVGRNGDPGPSPEARLEFALKVVEADLVMEALSAVDVAVATGQHTQVLPLMVEAVDWSTEKLCFLGVPDHRISDARKEVRRAIDDHCARTVAWWKVAKEGARGEEEGYESMFASPASE
ncbi:hypothetical protein HK405_008246, partial [Cladochytrium tenue]